MGACPYPPRACVPYVELRSALYIFTAKFNLL
jgi:hypothetical protein